jgi:hypothetical protein
MESDPSDFFDAWTAGHYSKRILVEGDSWTGYPIPNLPHDVTNIAIQIENLESDWLGLNLSYFGDTAEAIFKARGRQMKLLKKVLKNPSWNSKFDLIFLSAAGNDIIGPDIITKGFVINKKDRPNLIGRELITDNFYDRVSEIASGYKRFLKLRDKDGDNAQTPVITHSYCYLKPRKVGISVGPFQFSSGWLRRHLEHQNIHDEDEQYEILVEMLDAFYKRIKPLEKDFDHFLVVDTRKLLLKHGVPNLDYWHDEIHPKAKGFRKITRYIKKQATEAGLWPT